MSFKIKESKLPLVGAPADSDDGGNALAVDATTLDSAFFFLSESGSLVVRKFKLRNKRDESMRIVTTEKIVSN